MNRTKGFIRLVSVLLSVLMVMSLACVGILADTTAPTDTSSPTDTVAPGTEITSPSPETSNPNAETSTPPDSTEVTTPEVTTPPEIISASLDLGNYKKNYFTGETFDPAEIYVVLSYIGLPSERIALSEFGNYAPATLSAADTKVTVKINDGFTLDIPVSVSNVEVASVTPSFDSSFKNKYLQGEKFDATGITLKVTYTNGKVETVSDPSKFTVYPSGALNNENLVVLSYGGKSISVRISVTPVSSITVTPNSTPLVFGQYQNFDKSKITVTANYAGGDTRVIDDYTVEHGGFEATGDGSITVKYYSASASVNVSVVELTGIRVTKRPAKTSYNEGEFLVSEGLEVSGIYIVSGNTVEAPISGYTVSAEKLIPNLDGEYEVVVMFRDLFEDIFTVSVSPIMQLNITALPNKIAYHEGEPLDLTGLVVQAVFANGQKLDNFTDYTVPQECLYVNSEAMPYIQYRDIKAVITVNVIAIRGIGVTKNPDRILYTEGEIFDPTGIEIMAYYEDDTFKVVEIGACTFPTEPLKIYDTSVSVKYKDFSYRLEIIVTDKIYAKSLDAVTLPNTSYVSGQTLSLDGLKLVLTLSNSQTETIDLANVTVTPAVGSQLFSGIDTEIVISYLYNNEQEITCTIPISVSDKSVVSLFISKYPSKMIYTEGETFDPTGMVVRAYYNDNTTEEITNYSVTNTPFIIGSSYAEEVRVYISVGESEQSFVVTVNPAIISMISVTTPPIKVNYNPGELFDPTGMIVKVTYASGKSYVLPEDMYTIVNNGAFKAGDSVVTIAFRGKTTSLSVSVSGDATTPSTSDTEPPITTPDTTPDQTTPDEPKVTTTPEVTTTVTPTDSTTQGSDDNSFGGLQIVFICLVFLIVALIVVLIIYYRRHFC